VVEDMHFGRIGIDASILVLDEGIIVPAIPKPTHDIDEFACNGISFVMLRVRLREIVGGACIGRGDTGAT